MFTKEEAKEIRVKFWEGFKRYCKRKHIYRKWVLTGVKIRSTQLKFYADREKALVLFQIDHKNELRRFEVYECMLSYQTLFRAECGDELKWEEEYTGIEGQEISAIYFELRGVNLYRMEDHERIYDFFRVTGGVPFPGGGSRADIHFLCRDNAFGGRSVLRVQGFN